MTRTQRPEKRSSPWRRIRRGLALLLLLASVTPLVLGLVYRHVAPPLSALMLIRLVQGYGLNYHWTPYQQISMNLKRAVVAAEDMRFCRHGGVDWTEADKVWRQFTEGRRPRGASTISMQVVKNLFLWPSRSYVRKALEIPLAYYIEAIWPKQRILEVYLNIVEWGPGRFGAEVAARAAFSRPAARLTRWQAASLAAILPAPLRRNTARPTPAQRRGAARIHRRMAVPGKWRDCL